jgi:hypothetical protein
MYLNKNTYGAGYVGKRYRKRQGEEVSRRKWFELNLA